MKDDEVDKTRKRSKTYPQQGTVGVACRGDQTTSHDSLPRNYAVVEQKGCPCSCSVGKNSLSLTS